MDPNDETTPERDAIADAVIEGIESTGGEVAEDEAVEPVVPEQAQAQEGEEGQPSEAEEAADGKPAEAKPPEKPDDKPVEGKDTPEKDEAVEQEIADLKMKGKTADRFRELTSQVKELAPLREQLEKAGIKDVAELPAVVQKAQFADEHLAMVKETGATSEQYGQTLDYLALVNKAATGDVASAEKAYEMLLPELQALASVLGKEIEGVADPLTQHADLQQAVQDGDVTRKHALELAAARTRQAQGQQRQQQTDQQTQQQQAVDQGRQALNQWDASMANDPAYQARREQLSQLVAFIRETLPPDQWLPATQRAYAALPPAPAAAPDKPPVGAVPLRPTGLRQPLEQAEFDNPEDALMAGIKAASGA